MQFSRRTVIAQIGLLAASSAPFPGLSRAGTPAGAPAASSKATALLHDALIWDDHSGFDPVAELGPGDVVGEMGVLERAQRNATVIATSPMRLFTLTGWDIRRLRKSAPDAVDHLRSVVAERKDHA